MYSDISMHKFVLITLLAKLSSKIILIEEKFEDDISLKDLISILNCLIINI